MCVCLVSFSFGSKRAMAFYSVWNTSGTYVEIGIEICSKPAPKAFLSSNGVAVMSTDLWAVLFVVSVTSIWCSLSDFRHEAAGYRYSSDRLKGQFPHRTGIY
ncbi:hypothetical protein V8F06_005215 [Rhypophila decipiens]